MALGVEIGCVSPVGQGDRKWEEVGVQDAIEVIGYQPPK